MELSIIRKRLRLNRMTLNQVKKTFCVEDERLQTRETWSSTMTDCFVNIINILMMRRRRRGEEEEGFWDTGTELTTR